MPDLPHLALPTVLPHPDAIAAWKQTKFDYEPGFWEFQYAAHRYLGGVSDEALRARYDAVVRNLQSIVSDDRDAIPIDSFLSSWYWYRKEHQTRCEFERRGLPLHRPLPVHVKRDLSAAPARPRSPNAGDVLFRYGSKKWLQELVAFGRLRMTAARDYALMEKDLARQDDELVKHSFSPGEYVTITLPDGRTSRPVGDVKYSVSGTDYFVYCVSNDWDPDLFQDFGADACVVIKNPDEFARRLENAAMGQLPGWYFHHCPVEYFDTHERRPNEHIDNAMSKEFRFAYQREYRFLLAGFGKSATGYKSLELGPLHDIAELHARP